MKGERLGAEISDVVRNLGGVGPAFSSLEEAGKALAGALAAHGQTLLVADDVWTAAQLEPFLAASEQSRLLVTTRCPRVLAGTRARQIAVDAVTGSVARHLLTQDLPVMHD